MTLKLVEDTGEVIEHHGCERCAKLQQQVDALESDVLSLERDLRGKRATIRALKADRDRARRDYVNREQVEQLMQLWRDFFHHPRARLDAERFDALRWGLETYDFVHCEYVLWGARDQPYVNKQGKVVDRLTFLFGTAEVFEGFANKGYLAKKRQQALND